MQVQATRLGRLAAGLAMCAGLAAAAEPAPTVLVTDFQAPPGAAWAWASRGLPELAAEALGERGVVTVDRDLLSVVKSEHELAAGRETVQGGLQMGQWLGAAYLLQGSVETTRLDNIRLFGTLTRVETAEQVGACSVEGDFKKDLQELMGRLVAGLTKSADLGRQATVPEKVNPVKPEALIFFQQGIDACAAGKPALAVGFFLSAEAMDARLSAAKEWEAHAYELGGLPRYAAAVRERAAAANAAAAAASAPTQTAQRVVSVLTPVWLGGTNAAAGSPAMSPLRLAMEEAVLDCKGIRLYRPESLAEAVAESDRQLSLQFNPGGASRYARWLAADAMLYSTVTPLANGKIELEVGLMDALTARRLKHVKREVPPALVKSALAVLARECMAGPQAITGAWNANDCSLSVVRSPLTEEEVERLPDFRKIALALDARMHGATKVHHNQMLADYYAYKGLRDLAGLELEEVLKLAEIQKPEMEAILASSYWWVNGYPCHSTISCELGSREWGTNFYDFAALDPSAATKARTRFTAIRNRLLNEYPASLGAYAVHFQEAKTAYRNGQWLTCLTSATAAWQCLETREHTRLIDHSSFLGMFNNKKTKAKIHISCLFLQGSACRKMGDLKQARLCFDQIQAIIEDEQLRNESQFQIPIICFEDEQLIVGVNPTTKAAAFRVTMEAERNGLITANPTAQSNVSVHNADSALAERIKQLSEQSETDPEKNLHYLREIIQVWNEMKPNRPSLCELIESAGVYASNIRGLPVDQRLAIAEDLSRAYLRVTGVDPDRLREYRSLELLEPRLQAIIRLYMRMGLGVESLVWANRLLEQPVDPTFGRILIEGHVAFMSECVDLSLIVTNIPGQPVTGNAPAVAIREHPTVQAIERFFEQHKDIPRIRVAHARFWQKLGERAAATRNYQTWYVACTNAQAIDPICAVSERADIFSARLAVASGAQDILIEAIQRRESLGPSLHPIPSEVWYTVGFLCIDEKAFDQALKAFRLFRETYNWADVTCDKTQISATQSDNSALWNLEYGEGLALAATGQVAEAAKRFRRLAQRLGTRPVFLWEAVGVGENGHQTGKPLGLLAAEALQKLHLDENSGSSKSEQPSAR